MRKIKFVTKVIFGLFFVAAGLNHFLSPDFYLMIMPPYLPLQSELVIISGVAEVVFGIGLLIPPMSRVSAWGLIALLIAVFPANIHMAANPELYPNISIALLWLRLPMQGVLILWAFWYTQEEADRSKANDVDC